MKQDSQFTDCLETALGSVAAPPPTPSPALPWPALTSPVSQLTSSALRAHAHLLLLPLAIPLLIFAAGASGDPRAGALLLLSAVSLFLLALSPFVAGAALRAART